MNGRVVNSRVASRRTCHGLAAYGRRATVPMTAAIHIQSIRLTGCESDELNK